MRPPVHALPLLLVWLVLHSDARRLSGWDGWATASACRQVSVTTGKSDSNGRLWGYENGASCAFKDEQQQALYANQATPLQDFGTARMCGEQPSQYNSQPDSLGRLWGVWWGNSCAFRSDAGIPVFYTDYTGKRYSGSSSPPTQSPSPVPSTPQPAPKTAQAADSSSATTTSAVHPSPTPVATSPPAASVVANPAANPSPAPAAKVLPTAVTPAPTAATSDSTCPCTSTSTTPVIILNATAVAEAVAQRLWRMFSDYTNGYEMTVSEAPNKNSTANDSTHTTLHPDRPPAQTPAGQQTQQVAALLASLLSAAEPAPQQNNGHSPLTMLQSALVAGAQHPAASSAPASLSGALVSSSANPDSNGIPLSTQAGGLTPIMNSTRASRNNVTPSPARNFGATNSSAQPATISIASATGTLTSSQGSGSIMQTPLLAALARGAVTAAGPAAVATGQDPTGSPAPLVVQQRPTTIDTFSPGGPFLTVPGDESASPNASSVSSKSGHLTSVLVHNVTRRRLLALELMAYALQATPIWQRAANTRALLKTQDTNNTYTAARDTHMTGSQLSENVRGPESSNTSDISSDTQAVTSLDCWVEELGTYQDLAQEVKCVRRGSNLADSLSPSVQGQQPADSTLTWQSAPACVHTANRTNSVADSSAML